MALASLVPFREGAMARPDAFIFGPFHRELDRMLEDLARSGGVYAPRMNVTETDKEIEVAAELPGLAREDIEVSVEDGALAIKGEKKIEAEHKDKAARLIERSYGKFYRMLELPSSVDPAGIQATMSKGVLKVTIPKSADANAKKIEVREAN